MSNAEVLLLLVMLFTKHFYVDFPLQTPYQFLNKGNYGHPGGLLHSGLHALATFGIVLMFAPMFALLLAVLDFTVHYHVDWAKMQLNDKFGWKADTHKEFWWFLGLDQWIHAMTYFAIAYVLIYV